MEFLTLCLIMLLGYCLVKIFDWVNDYRLYRFKKLKDCPADSLGRNHYDSLANHVLRREDLGCFYDQRRKLRIIKGTPKHYFDWLDSWIAQGGKVSHSSQDLTRWQESSISHGRPRSVYVARKGIKRYELYGIGSHILVVKKGVSVESGDYGHCEVYGYDADGKAIIISSRTPTLPTCYTNYVLRRQSLGIAPQATS